MAISFKTRQKQDLSASPVLSSALESKPTTEGSCVLAKSFSFSLVSKPTKTSWQKYPGLSQAGVIPFTPNYPFILNKNIKIKRKLLQKK